MLDQAMPGWPVTSRKRREKPAALAVGVVTSPDVRELTNLYEQQQLSLAAIGRKYGRGPDWVKARLIRAGVSIRPGGSRRIITDDQVRELLHRGYRTDQIAEALGCAPWTVLQVMRRNGWPGPPRRPRGPTKSLAPLPDRTTLLKIAPPEQLDPRLVASELGIPPYRARRALVAAGLNRPLGTTSRSAPPVDPDVVRQMYIQLDLSIAEIARRLGTSRSRVQGALDRAGVPRRPKSAAPTIDAEQLRELYDNQRLDDKAIGALLQVPAYHVRKRREELRLRRTTPPPPKPTLPPHEVKQIAQLYQSGKTLAQIAKTHHTSAPRIRQILADQAVPVKPRTDRAHRKVPAPQRLRELYQARGWSAIEIAAEYDISQNVVLRTLHDHRVPVRTVRSSDRPRKRRPPLVRLRELYADPDILALLSKFDLPIRRQRGPLSRRFPTPLTLPDKFLVTAYRDIGLAAAHIEMLTGVPADRIRRELRDIGVQVRNSGKSPWLTRRIAAT